MLKKYVLKLIFLLKLKLNFTLYQYSRFQNCRDNLLSIKYYIVYVQSRTRNKEKRLAIRNDSVLTNFCLFASFDWTLIEAIIN